MRPTTNGPMWRSARCKKPLTPCCPLSPGVWKMPAGPASAEAPAAAGAGRAAPLIAHVIYRLDVGGLENGLVNLINRIPADRFRHAIVCLTDYSEFSRRIRRDD